MRILFLTQWFQPEPFFKGIPFAKALRERGHNVEILTGFPNYPAGKLYPGYRIRLYQRETMDGIRVHRIPLYPSHDRSAICRMLNYLSFSISALLLGPWISGRSDVIYVYNLVTLGPPAFLQRLLFGSKVLIDVQDLWPESVINSGMLRNKIALCALNKISAWVYRGADRLTALSPGFEVELRSRGVPAEKIDVIYNWCDERSITRNSKAPSTIKERSGFAEKFVVLFAGAMGILQGLDTLLDCACLSMNSLPDVHFVLVGDGVERSRLQQRVRDMGLNNLTFLPPRPMEQMGEVFAMADALIVHLVDDRLLRITIPSKTQAYLYAGKPIIMAIAGDAGDLVKHAGAGMLCEPENPEAMMATIKALYEMPATERQSMGESGHRYYMEHLSLHQGVERFEKAMMLLSVRGS